MGITVTEVISVIEAIWVAEGILAIIELAGRTDIISLITGTTGAGIMDQGGTEIHGLTLTADPILDPAVTTIARIGRIPCTVRTDSHEVTVLLMT